MSDHNSQPSKVTNKIHQQNKLLHDREAEVYDQIRGELWNFWEQRRIFQDIEKIDQLISKGKIADIGCGTGNIALKFNELGYQVEAVDISKNMLQILKQKLSERDEEKSIDLHCMKADDFLEIEAVRGVHAICFSSVLHHLPQYLETLKKSISLLPRGGIIYIVHEPLHSKDGDKPQIGKVLDALLAPRSTWGKREAPTNESRLVDYHIDNSQGLDLTKIKFLLKTNSMEILSEDKYTPWKSGIVSAAGELINLDRPTDFKLLAQKSNN